MTMKRLEQRAIIRLSPRDPSENVREFLQGLVTNDVSKDLPVYAALLSAQGKSMFDFLVWSDGLDLLIDCESAVADNLVKRLSLYRLRRAIDIARDNMLAVYWGLNGAEGTPDPRLPELGQRAIGPATASEAADREYLMHRLSLGVPEGQAELLDILWLETNAVELNGVSFKKGCYIGQENTARMNWRQKINRRLVVVKLDQSDEKRCKATYPDLGFAVDHLQVSGMDPAAMPAWQARAIIG